MRLPDLGRPRVLLAVGGLAVVLSLAGRFDRLQIGLNGRYVSSLDDQGAPARTTVDAPPSAAAISAAWDGSVPETFSATWTGAVLAPSDGRYTFATRSDDASHVYVDGQLVVDNGGAHGPELRRGTIALTRGFHAVLIDYNQQGGPFELDWLWARGEERLRAVPAWALATRSVGLGRFAVTAARWAAGLACQWLAVWLMVFMIVRRATRGLRPIREQLEREGAWPILRWILAGSLLLNAIAVWWGVPDHWAAIELDSKSVFEGLVQHFSHGWSDPYPPVHFYLLSVAAVPWFVLDWLGAFRLGSDAGEVALMLTFRAISLAMAAGIVTVVCRVGTRVFGSRAGLCAAAVFALVTPFLYYAKTANTDVPYLFWFALAFWFYFNVLDQLRLRDFVLFSLTTTLSVCTKDQAYGLFLLMPLPIIERIYRVHRDGGMSRPWLRALMDRGLITAAVVSAVVFGLVHNVVFNWTGFREHVQFVVGPGHSDYRVYDPTLSGWAQLLAMTAFQIQESFGWPAMFFAGAGLAIALYERATRRVSIWLLTPVASYYVTFIIVILYTYDRFMLPVCLVLSIFAGHALDRLLARSTGRDWRAALVVAAGLYTLLYAGTVDVLMLRDSRYEARRWLGDRVQDDTLVGSMFSEEYLPNLDGFRHSSINLVDELNQQRPRYYVLNADYARAVHADTAAGQLLAGLQDGSLGYRRVARFRSPSPWPWLPFAHHELTGPRFEPRVFVILRNVNPTIEIYQRVAGS